MKFPTLEKRLLSNDNVTSGHWSGSEWLKEIAYDVQYMSLHVFAYSQRFAAHLCLVHDAEGPQSLSLKAQWVGQRQQQRPPIAACVCTCVCMHAPVESIAPLCDGLE